MKRQEMVFDPFQLIDKKDRKQLTRRNDRIGFAYICSHFAAIGASGIGWIVARRLFSLEFAFDPWVWVAGLIFGTVLVGVSGTLATRRVVNTPPIVTLRDE